MAKHLGPFTEFERNREYMLNVLKMHKEEIDKISDGDLPLEMRVVKEAARISFNKAITIGEEYGFRNAQATVLAPTGTIAFMMDCDTTGIEPDLSLKKTKLLAGGGVLEIVNQSVGPALERLGYEGEQKERILKYIDENGNVEDCKDLKEEHISVFDCSFKCNGGERFISYMGHLKMMAAVQPFISGAISKTVNMPKDARVEDIEKAYIDSWKMGLKSVAIYRDGSKRRQPLNAAEKKGMLEKKVSAFSGPIRKRLPTTRPAINHKFEFEGGHEGYITYGIYPDTGKVGEMFITMAKEGSTVGGMMDAFATAISLCLQYQVPLRDLVKKFRGMRFEPSGKVIEGNRNIPIALSPIDYIFRDIADRFPKQSGFEDEQKLKEIMDKVVKEEDEKNKQNGNYSALFEEPSGNFCLACSSPMVKKGCLEICTNPHCRLPDAKGCSK